MKVIIYHLAFKQSAWWSNKKEYKKEMVFRKQTLSGIHCEIKQCDK